MTDEEDHLAVDNNDPDIGQLRGDPPETVLTANQRGYLRGSNWDGADSSERTLRKSIRENIKHSWIDTAIAFEHLEPQDRAQLFFRREGNRDRLQDYSGEVEPTGPPELFWSYVIAGDEPDSPVIGTGGFRQVLALGFLSLYDGLVDNHDWPEEQYEKVIEALVTGALQDALAKVDRTPTVDVTIDIGDENRERPPETLETIELVRLLYAMREIDPEEFWSFVGVEIEDESK